MINDFIEKLEKRFGRVLLGNTGHMFQRTLGRLGVPPVAYFAYGEVGEGEVRFEFEVLRTKPFSDKKQAAEDLNNKITAFCEGNDGPDKALVWRRFPGVDFNGLRYVGYCRLQILPVALTPKEEGG